MYEGQRSSEPVENKQEIESSQKTEPESVGSHDSHMTNKEKEDEDDKQSEAGVLSKILFVNKYCKWSKYMYVCCTCVFDIICIMYSTCK